MRLRFAKGARGVSGCSQSIVITGGDVGLRCGATLPTIVAQSATSATCNESTSQHASRQIACYEARSIRDKDAKSAGDPRPTAADNRGDSHPLLGWTEGVRNAGARGDYREQPPDVSVRMVVAVVPAASQPQRSAAATMT